MGHLLSQANESVTGVLVPKYATDAPSPVQHLNPLASLCVLTALHHHIWEFRSQLSVYMSLGVEVPFGEPVNGGRQPREVENGFEGRKVVRQCTYNADIPSGSKTRCLPGSRNIMTRVTIIL